MSVNKGVNFAVIFVRGCYDSSPKTNVTFSTVLKMFTDLKCPFSMKNYISATYITVDPIKCFYVLVFILFIILQ